MAASLFGGFQSASPIALLIVLPGWAAGVVLIFSASLPLNAFCLGAEHAYAAGVDPERVPARVLAGTALTTAAVCSQAGALYFWGILSTAFLRYSNELDSRVTLPCAFLTGAGLAAGIHALLTRFTDNMIPSGLIGLLIGAAVLVMLRGKSE